jgi:hypothetical protein
VAAVGGAWAAASRAARAPGRLQRIGGAASPGKLAECSWCVQAFGSLASQGPTAGFLELLHRSFVCSAPCSQRSRCASLGGAYTVPHALRSLVQGQGWKWAEAGKMP